MSTPARNSGKRGVLGKRGNLAETGARLVARLVGGDG